MAVMHYGVWLLYSFDERNQRATFGLPLHTNFQKMKNFTFLKVGGYMKTIVRKNVTGKTNYLLPGDTLRSMCSRSALRNTANTTAMLPIKISSLMNIPSKVVWLAPTPIQMTEIKN